jgi:predicted transposase/invertase (TIGR01784 family)
MPLGIDPTVDYAFKKIFGDPENADLLVHLLNAVLRQSPPIAEVTILNPFNEKEFATDKLSVLDIKARAAQGAWFNVEIQNKAHWSLRPRLAYYNASLYVGQLGEGEEYKALTPAVTICFLSEVLFREVDAPHLRFAMCDCRHGLELTDRLQIHTIELPKYNFEQRPVPLKDGLIQWAFFLSRAAELERETLKRLLPSPEFAKAIGVVEMIAKTPEERMQYEARRKAEMDFRSFVADAREEGREEGREEVREQVLRQGIADHVQSFQRLLGETVVPKEDLMKLESDALKELRDELEKRLQARI